MEQIPWILVWLFIIFGVGNVLYPRVFRHLGIGWRFKTSEPSAAALVMARIKGGLVIGAGVFLFFSGILP